MNMIIMNLSIMISLILPFSKHPLSMGMLLIMQTITIATITGLMINTFWFSYMLIITTLSGLLVLFIYMASMASNEKFIMSMKISLFMISSILLTFIISFMVDHISTSKMWSTIKKMTMENDQINNMLKMYNMHNMSITIFIICYLFMTMIVVSFIVNVHEGPLRASN